MDSAASATLEVKETEAAGMEVMREYLYEEEAGVSLM